MFAFSIPRNLQTHDPQFPNNSIRTTKYTFLTFIPLNLFEQFHRLANWYFLLVIVLNWVLALFGKEVSLLPLLFVLGATGVKDFYEDWRRRKSDKALNSHPTQRLQAGSLVSINWSDVHVGDLIQLHHDETIPADILVLVTPDGRCYVETTNLDGENNIKERDALWPGLSLSITDLPRWADNLHASFNFSPPNKDLEMIYGSVAHGEDNDVKFGPSNMLLRGCTLRHTEWAVGIALHTGRNTKAMMNSGNQIPKRSKLEKKMNREILTLAVMLFSMCLITALGTFVWEKDHEKFAKIINHWSPGWHLVESFLVSIIQYQVMIPIALYMTLEPLKLINSWLIQQDIELYHSETDTPATCRALNIPENLGQIQHVFADKTGTLTDNIMLLQTVYFNLSHRTLHVGDLLHNSSTYLSEITRMEEEYLLLAMSMCNTVLPHPFPDQVTDLNNIPYQYESPDEHALVLGAKTFNYVLTERKRDPPDDELLILKHPDGNLWSYRMVLRLDFDNVRKCMTVVLRTPDNKLLVLCKGADTSVMSCLREQNDTDVLVQQTLDFSKEGLRTLWFSYRYTTDDEYMKSKELVRRGRSDPVRRKQLIQEAALIMENNMIPLGVTAIEDKLQDKVSDTIESLRMAGLKVWVLTGDKQETAINIAFSCSLIDQYMELVVINTKTVDEYVGIVKNAMSLDTKNIALVIDGGSLSMALDHQNNKDFYNLTLKCAVVLCCRVSPGQKAEVVGLVKTFSSSVTLAIGDGANDVAMLKKADVGVGISGSEGQQAVMSSDFSIGRFKFLKDLLFVHGHWCYHRLCFMVLYFLYKNALFCFLLFHYQFFCAFTSTTTMDEWSLVLFSVIDTSLPPLIIGILDQHLSRKPLSQHPILYSYGSESKLYNPIIFWLYILDLLIQSAIIHYFPLFIYANTYPSSIWSVGLGQFFPAVIVVNLILILDSYYITWHFVLSVVLSILVAFFSTWVTNMILLMKHSYSFNETFVDPLFWLTIVLTTISALIPHFTFRAIQVNLFPTIFDAVRMKLVSPSPIQTREASVAQQISVESGQYGSVPTFVEGTMTPAPTPVSSNNSNG